MRQPVVALFGLAATLVAATAFAGPPVDGARGAARPGTRAPAAGVPRVTPCPEHWKLVAGSLSPDGSFTCEPDTAWYQRQITCPPGTTAVNLPCGIGCMAIVN